VNLRNGRTKKRNNSATLFFLAAWLSEVDDSDAAYLWVRLSLEPPVHGSQDQKAPIEAIPEQDEREEVNIREA
jgi:hypothetical protein